jgi:hypothetical protein
VVGGATFIRGAQAQHRIPALRAVSGALLVGELAVPAPVARGFPRVLGGLALGL